MATSAVVCAGLGWAVQWGAERLRQAKEGQHLDPVLSLCTLATRVLACNKDAKPAARGHVFQFDKKTLLQPIWRAWSGVSNDDLFFINDNIKLLAIGWQASEYPSLVKIANIVLQAFEIMRVKYAEEYKNAAPALEHYHTMLRDWINSAELPKVPPPASADAKKIEVSDLKEFLKKLTIAEPEKEKKERCLKRLEQLVCRYELTPELPTPSSVQLKVITSIKKLWDKETVDSFELLLRNGDENEKALESILIKQQAKYVTWLNSDDATNCFTIEAAPSASPSKTTK